MKKIVENRTLKSAAAEFLAFKRAQKIRERTLYDYQKYIILFIEQSPKSMGIDVLRTEILDYFANTPTTSPAITTFLASVNLLLLLAKTRYLLLDFCNYLLLRS